MLRAISGLAFASILLLAEFADAVPVTFQFLAITSDPAATFAPFALLNPPILGSGDLGFDASGNLLSGQLSLPPYTILFDANGDGLYDLEFDTTGSTQTLAAAPLTGGAIDLAGGSVTGTNTCTILPVAPPGTVCAGGSGRPFGDDISASTSVATLMFARFTSPTDFAGTITWVFSNAAAGGVDNTRFYSFASAVPEPSLLALMAAPLALAWAAVRRRS